MARSSQDSSSSSSKRHFHWTNKVRAEDDHEAAATPIPTFKSSSSTREKDKESINTTKSHVPSAPILQTPRRKLPAVAVARLRSVLNNLGRGRSGTPTGLGARVVGTLFGSRRGHVHFALQRDPGSPPAFLVELATPISGLVREMASGLVRIALECDKAKENTNNGHQGGHDKRPSHNSNNVMMMRRQLLEEPTWRTYCNGRKCGFATRRESGVRDLKVLKAVEPISMGAGVLPGGSNAGGGEEEEIMYMRAKFERIVGSRDSEAFYMMNPDSNGAPELSIYLLRV